MPAVVAHDDDLRRLITDAAARSASTRRACCPTRSDGVHDDAVVPAHVVRLVPTGTEPVDAPDAWAVLQAHPGRRDRRR